MYESVNTLISSVYMTRSFSWTNDIMLTQGQELVDLWTTMKYDA